MIRFLKNLRTNMIISAITKIINSINRRLKFLENILVDSLKNVMKKDEAKTEIITEVLKQTHQNYPAMCGESLKQLKSLLEKEATRIEEFTEYSILVERVQRANITFLWTTGIGIILLYLTMDKPGNRQIISTILIAFARWLDSYFTSLLSENLRMLGGMNSTANTYIKLNIHRLSPPHPPAREITPPPRQERFISIDIRPDVDSSNSQEIPSIRPSLV